MDKWTYVKKVAGKTGLSQDEVNKVMTAMISVIVDEVRDGGETVSFPGLGMFKQKVNEARVGRNPMNGQKVNIAANRTIAFKVSSAIKVAE